MNLIQVMTCLFLLSATLFSCKTRQTQIRKMQQKQATAVKIDIIDNEALNIFDTSEKIETITKGFGWTEGPLYVEDGGYLLFSDVINNKIYKWKEGQGVTVYLNPSGNTGTISSNEPGSNGLVLDREGQLVLCQHGDRRIAKMISPLNNPKPEFLTLADNYKGKRFNSPNDAVYHANGDLYFTDPPYGLQKGIEDSSRQLDFQGVYRLKPGGQVDLITRELKYPNGIALSPDGKFLYVANSGNENFVWMKYELDTNGLIKNRHIFYEAHSYEGKNSGAPDGLKVNKKGYVFASGPLGLWIFAPAGKLIARLYTGQLTSNCTFSPDEHTLFITCDDYVMRLKLKRN
jgi:gluconolactonase